VELGASAWGFLLAALHLLVVLRLLRVVLRTVRLPVLDLLVAIQMGFLVMLVSHELLGDPADPAL
jgi:hypothetical protein